MWLFCTVFMESVVVTFLNRGWGGCSSENRQTNKDREDKQISHHCWSMSHNVSISAYTIMTTGCHYQNRCTGITVSAHTSSNMHPMSVNTDQIIHLRLKCVRSMTNQNRKNDCFQTGFPKKGCIYSILTKINKNK